MRNGWLQIVAVCIVLALTGCVRGPRVTETITDDEGTYTLKYRGAIVTPPTAAKVDPSMWTFIYDLNDLGDKSQSHWAMGENVGAMDTTAQAEIIKASFDALVAALEKLAPILQLLAAPELSVSGLGAKLVAPAIIPTTP